jgi:hypothetical protein
MQTNVAAAGRSKLQPLAEGSAWKIFNVAIDSWEASAVHAGHRPRRASLVWLLP